MFSTVNNFQTCKAGSFKLTVVFNTNYCQTFESLQHLNLNYNILILKETLDAKYLLLHINVSLQCVDTTTLQW